MNSFWEGFEKQAAIDWFYRNRNKARDNVHQSLGPGYEKEHIQSYVKNFRPWESGKSEGEWGKDIKRLYDKKEAYNKVQKGLLATKPGSSEEGKYMKRYGKDLDSKIKDWAKDNATTAGSYNSPYAKRLSAMSSLLERMHP